MTLYCHNWRTVQVLSMGLSLCSRFVQHHSGCVVHLLYDLLLGFGSCWLAAAFLKAAAPMLSWRLKRDWPA
jgi:hypothetical protein